MQAGSVFEAIDVPDISLFFCKPASLWFFVLFGAQESKATDRRRASVTRLVEDWWPTRHGRLKVP